MLAARCSTRFPSVAAGSDIEVRYRRRRRCGGSHAENVAMIRIIIGAGTSAAVFRKAISQTIDEEVFTNPRAALVKLSQTVQVGQTEPWHRRGQHKMGQPASIVGGQMLPGSERSYQQATGKPEQVISEQFVADFLKGFQTSSTFAEQLDRLQQINGQRDQALVFDRQTVKRVARSTIMRDYIDVTLSNDMVLHGTQVIIATGPGAEKQYPANMFTGDKPLDWQVLSGPDFMESRPPEGARYDLGTRPWTVAVSGGSATAAWSVETALIRGYRVETWFQRLAEKGDNDKQTRFAAAFPPGNRNFMVRSVLNEVGRVINLTKIEVVAGTNALVWPRRVVALTFGDKEPPIYVDQFVYSIGSDFDGAGAIGPMLSTELKNELRPYRDFDRVVSDDGSAVLALGTDDRSLFIVGSAVFNAIGATAMHTALDNTKTAKATYQNVTGANYAQIAKTLPESAVPPEGIGLIMASIEAFTNFMPVAKGTQTATFTVPQNLTEKGKTHLPNPRAGQKVTLDTRFEWDINLNTANRNQIAAWIASTTDLTPCAANLAVALIVEIRAKRTFGLQNERIEMIKAVSSDVCAKHGRLFEKPADPFLPDRIAAAVAPRFVEYIKKD
jgi:hypothetical protein